jgi:hypothetical protein
MPEMLHNVWVVAKREFAAYFATPIATVFLVIFVALTGVFAFYVGGFFERGQAELSPFFLYHPWLYLILVPAIGMRLWAEERKSGTIELLMTLPISPWEAILGKFLAAWAFVGLALVLTFPMWITVNVLGRPDNGRPCSSKSGCGVPAERCCTHHLFQSGHVSRPCPRHQQGNTPPTHRNGRARVVGNLDETQPAGSPGTQTSHSVVSGLWIMSR